MPALIIPETRESIERARQAQQRERHEAIQAIPDAHGRELLRRHFEQSDALFAAQMSREVQ